jgi:quercetin dioxygenase-like cupin family protein
VTPRTVWLPGDLRVEVLLGAADTGGQLTLAADFPPPGWRLPPHAHANEAETIHIVAGRFAITVDGDERELGPGEAVHVPRGVVHSARAVGDAPGHRLVMFTPGGMDAFFLEAGAADPAAEPDLAHLVAIAKAHGWSFDV